jgi:DNA repair protein RadC
MQQMKNQFTEAELKVSFTPVKNPVRVCGSHEVVPFLYEIWDQDLINLQEQFYVLYLNNAKDIVCWRCLHTGMMTSTVLDIRMLFGFALGCGATGIIVAHNHPTGQLKPSNSDISLTITIKMAGELLDVPLLDHIIIGNGKGFSFRDEGLIT